MFGLTMGEWGGRMLVRIEGLRDWKPMDMY